MKYTSIFLISDHTKLLKLFRLFLSGLSSPTLKLDQIIFDNRSTKLRVKLLLTLLKFIDPFISIDKRTVDIIKPKSGKILNNYISSIQSVTSKYFVILNPNDDIDPVEFNKVNCFESNEDLILITKNKSNKNRYRLHPNKIEKSEIITKSGDLMIPNHLEGNLIRTDFYKESQLTQEIHSPSLILSELISQAQVILTLENNYYKREIYSGSSLSVFVDFILICNAFKLNNRGDVKSFIPSAIIYSHLKYLKDTDKFVMINKEMFNENMKQILDILSLDINDTNNKVLMNNYYVLLWSIRSLVEKGNLN